MVRSSSKRVDTASVKLMRFRSFTMQMLNLAYHHVLTASVYQGGGDILDIERSVELGGSLHAKGVLLMSSFLKAHFGREQTLHFSAALAFEQSYGQVDGDSATVAGTLRFNLCD